MLLYVERLIYNRLRELKLQSKYSILNMFLDRLVLQGRCLYRRVSELWKREKR
jgi:hypothetical protein